MSETIEKAIFLNSVSAKIAEHPEWMADLQMAIQRGIATALESERDKVAALAYGLSLLDFRNHREFNKLINDGRAEKMRAALVAFFAGSEFGETLK